MRTGSKLQWFVNICVRVFLQILMFEYRTPMQGSCNTPKPGFFELVEEVKKRWHAWNNLRNMSHDQAVDQFLGVIEQIQPDWEDWPGFPTPGEDDLTYVICVQICAILFSLHRVCAAKNSSKQRQLEYKHTSVNSLP
jgi:acyl-CoA-binding protein